MRCIIIITLHAFLRHSRVFFFLALLHLLARGKWLRPLHSGTNHQKIYISKEKNHLSMIQKPFNLKSVVKKMKNKVFVSINWHFFYPFLFNWFQIKRFSKHFLLIRKFEKYDKVANFFFVITEYHSGYLWTSHKFLHQYRTNTCIGSSKLFRTQNSNQKWFFG